VELGEGLGIEVDRDDFRSGFKKGSGDGESDAVWLRR